MSDVREELRKSFEHFGWTGSDELADIVLARFEVTPKPVVTALDMGLRQYLTLVVVNQAIKRPVPDLTDAHPIWVRETVDAILAEIAASGYSIVATDRFERLRHHAELLFRDFPLAQEAGIGPPDRDKRLLPGDLDPLAGGDR